MNKPLDQEAGWKLDPDDQNQVRFWNGSHWTSHCEAAGSEAELYAAAELGESVELPARPDPRRSVPRVATRPKPAPRGKRKPEDLSPGWKPDPADPARLRYWKGAYWTQMYAVENPEDPTGPPVPVKGEGGSSGFVEIGYLLAILLPIVGFIVGLVLISRDDENGGKVMLASVLCGVGWVILFSYL